MTQEKNKYLKVSEVATLLNCSMAKVYKLTREKRIGSFDIAGSQRISQAHLDEYLAKAESKANDAEGE